mgnify:CR=1 FL=1
MKDFNNNVLAIGDTVAFLEPNYRHMVAGKVIGFTAKMIRVEYSDVALVAEGFWKQKTMPSASSK